MKKIISFIFAIVMVFALSACNEQSVSFQDSLYDFLMGLNKSHFSMTEFVGGYVKGEKPYIQTIPYNGVIPLKLNDFTAEDYLRHNMEFWSEKQMQIPEEQLKEYIEKAESLAKDNENFITLIFSQNNKIFRKESIDNRLISFDNILGINLYTGYVLIDEKIINDDGTVRFVLRYTASA